MTRRFDFAGDLFIIRAGYESMWTEYWPSLGIRKGYLLCQHGVQKGEILDHEVDPRIPRRRLYRVPPGRVGGFECSTSVNVGSVCNGICTCGLDRTRHLPGWGLTNVKGSSKKSYCTNLRTGWVEACEEKRQLRPNENSWHYLFGVSIHYEIRAIGRRRKVQYFSWLHWSEIILGLPNGYVTAVVNFRQCLASAFQRAVNFSHLRYQLLFAKRLISFQLKSPTVEGNIACFALACSSELQEKLILSPEYRKT